MIPKREEKERNILVLRIRCPKIRKVAPEEEKSR